jgi:ubiquinol-cytochrome c reductase iron-sulfur subunit
MQTITLNRSEPQAVASPGRRLAIASTAIIGGAGLIATAVPFVSYLAPSEKARALGGPVDVDLTGIRPGALKTVEWRGRPIFVLLRTPEMVAALSRHDELLSDPQSQASSQPAYAKNVGRSVKTDLAVLTGVCTHLGCVPNFRPVPGAEYGVDWPGGFHCPCHGSKFDLAGRVFKGVPAPTNLTVPPYEFTSETTLRIGLDPKA